MFNFVVDQILSHGRAARRHYPAKRRTTGRPSRLVEALESKTLLTAIGNGQELLATLDVGESRSFEVAASVGDTVRFSVGETDAVNNFLGTPRVEVFAPNGSSIGADSGTNNAEFQFSASATGTYTAVVRDSLDDDALGFRIRALVVPGDAAPGLIAERDAILTSGQELEANIPLGSFAVYQLDASVGETVRVSVGETNAVNNSQATPFLQIIGPDGNSIGTDSGSDNAAMQFAAATTGTYTAIVRDSLSDDEMGFRIRAVVVPGSSAPSLITDRDAILTSGQELEASIPLGSFAVYRLEADVGDMVRFSVGETDAVNNFLATPRVEIFRPDGMSVDIDSGNENAELQFSANLSGTYTAIVRDSLDDNAMGFRIRVLVVPGGADPGLIAERDAILTSGQELEANIPLGSFAVYRLDASVGETVRVSIGETNAVNNFQATPFLQIIGPDGNSIGTDSGSDNAELQFAAATTGTYTAIVRDSLNDDAMGFRIRAVVVPGSSAPSLITDRDAILASGQELEASIPLGSFAIYQLNAAIGNTVRVSVGETNAVNNFLATPRVEIFAPDGSSIDTDSGTDNAESQFAAGSTGTYTVIVRDSQNDNAMGFRIRALVIPGTSAPVLVGGRDSLLIDGQEVAASVPLGSFAVYQFTASTGAAVTLTVTETDAVNNFQATPFLQVLDPGGTSVNTDSGASDAELQFSAATTVTYTAIVRDSLSDDAMGFRIAATIEGGTASDTTPPVVDLNGVATGANFSTTYDFQAGGAQPIGNSELTVTETESQIQSAEVVIAEGLQTGDLLTVDAVTGISSQFANGTLTLTGTTDSAAYQTALRSLKLTATSGTTVTRQVAVRVTDAAGNVSLTRTITVAPVATDNNAVLDVDGSGGDAAAQSDGLLIFAVLAGVTSESQLSGLVASGSTRSVAQIVTRVQELRDSLQLDVDDDGAVNAQSDGLLIFAVLAGVTNASQLEDLMGGTAQRTAEQVVAAVQALRTPPTSTAAANAQTAAVMADTFSVSLLNTTTVQHELSLADSNHADQPTTGSAITPARPQVRTAARTMNWYSPASAPLADANSKQELSLLDDLFLDLQHDQELLN
jgi:hypothetical protein